MSMECASRVGNVMVVLRSLLFKLAVFSLLLSCTIGQFVDICAHTSYSVYTNG